MLGTAARPKSAPWLDVLVVDAEPVGYPRAPVSRKRVWIDLRNMIFIGYVTYDRRGEIWRSFEAGFSQQAKGDLANLEKNGKPAWSWSYVMAQDVQTGRSTRFNHAPYIRGVKASFDMEGAYDKYLTVQALRRLGT